MTPDVLAFIQRYAVQFSLDPVLFMAICEHESGWDGWRVRHEPTWRYLYFPKDFAEKLGITLATETVLQSSSWGLGQVMGSVARELGYFDHLTKLCLPENGLFYSAKKLNSIMRRWKQPSDIVSAYNAGQPKRYESGLYLNQAYVDAVFANYNRLKGEGHVS